MRKKREKLGIKFYVAITFVVAMLAAVILISYQDGRKAEYQKKTAAIQMDKSAEMLGADKEKTEETQSREEGNRENQEPQAAYIKIENQKEFIEPVLGNRTYALGQKLWAYVQQAGIEADSAKCMDCSVPLEDPSATEFYLELDDKEKTLITASYKSETYEIEIKACQYTREEIAEAAWMLDNGPAIRDAEDKE